jgi:hypothetical protein
LRLAGFDVQPIVRYLHSIPAFLCAAAARLRERLDGLRHAAIGAGAQLHVHLRRLSHSTVGAAAHLRTHVDRLSYRLAGASQRLRSDLGRVPRRAADRRRAKEAPVETPAPAPRLAPGRQWEIVVGIAERELARVPAIAALQVRAAVKIDAAEHALGRIIADCAKVFAVPAAPAAQPAQQPTARPEAPARRPLAA